MSKRAIVFSMLIGIPLALALGASALLIGQNLGQGPRAQMTITSGSSSKGDDHYAHVIMATQYGNATMYFPMEPGMTQHQFTWRVDPAVTAVTVTFSGSLGGSYTQIATSSALGGTITGTGSYTQFKVQYSSYAGSGAIDADYYGVNSLVASPLNTHNVAPDIAQSSGATPTAVAAATSVQANADLSGTTYVRTGGPNQFTCYARGVAGSLADFTQVAGSTGCGATPGAGLRAYITDITASSTTTTGGTFRLSYGTGAACATTNNALFPANTSDTWNYPPNSAGTNPLTISFNQPLVPAAANRLCVIGTATNTLNISINGFIAP